MIRLINPKEKREAFDLLELNLKRLIFIGVPREQIGLIQQHLAYLRADKRELHVTSKLETFPELEVTRLVIDYSFASKEVKQ